VQNTKRLLDAAKIAGVRRFVHVSIANPSLESRLGYYRRKAQVERAVCESGLSYAILRPTVIFGAEDILINNIAWFVRTFPVFAVPGNGRYKVRPIYVEDMAEELLLALIPSVVFRMRGYSNEQLNLKSANLKSDVLVIVVVLAFSAGLDMTGPNIFQLTRHQQIIGLMSFWLHLFGTDLPIMIVIYSILMPRYFKLFSPLNGLSAGRGELSDDAYL
jgi:hypothetical protein